MSRILSVWVDNKRACSPASPASSTRRGFNIESLAVSITEEDAQPRDDGGRCRRAHRRAGDRSFTSSSTYKVTDLTDKDHIERELVF